MPGEEQHHSLFNKLADNPAILLAVILGGAILFLVLITIVTAAVIGTFVLGAGNESTPQTPVVQFEHDYDSTGNTVTITHAGGDNINPETITITNTDTNTDTNWDDPDGEITAGETTTVNAAPDDTIKITYKHPDKDYTEILSWYTAGE